MAKTTKADSSRTNRVRFMMLDADLSDGNLSELTQAIAAAMGRSAPGTRLVSLPPTLATQPPANGNGHGHLDGASLAVEPEEVADVVEDGEETSRTPRKAANFKMPKYVKELFDREQGEAFKAAHGAVSGHSLRYLVAAHWLKEKLGKPALTIDDVYTCYKTAGWSPNIKDWDSFFRNHSNKTEKMRRVAQGEYEITPIGESSIPAPAGSN